MTPFLIGLSGIWVCYNNNIDVILNIFYLLFQHYIVKEKHLWNMK